MDMLVYILGINWYNKIKNERSDIMNLWDKIDGILEDEEINKYETTEQDGEYFNEVEFYSPCDEDVVETVWHDNTPSGFVKGFRKCAESFDVDEHVELWVDGRGKNGVPATVRELLEDAEAIKDKLMTVADRLESEVK